MMESGWKYDVNFDGFPVVTYNGAILGFSDTTALGVAGSSKLGEKLA